MESLSFLFGLFQVTILMDNLYCNENKKMKEKYLYVDIHICRKLIFRI